jgi:DNA-binding protein HU-beta
MTIDDIVTELAERASVSRAVAREVLRRYQELITEQLQKSEDFELRGIGRFRVKEAPARVGRNPRTGEQIDIPAARRVAFAPSTALKRTMAEVTA